MTEANLPKVSKHQCSTYFVDIWAPQYVQYVLQLGPSVDYIITTHPVLRGKIWDQEYDTTIWTLWAIYH